MFLTFIKVRTNVWLYLPADYGTGGGLAVDVGSLAGLRGTWACGHLTAL